jgi:hypothetical protein
VRSAANLGTTNLLPVQFLGVPYIADLVATRSFPLNTRGRRIDVAKTIYYRRRKGTVRILEELVNDITGWGGKVVEEFRHLARNWHGLDPRPDLFLGRFTGTPPGGFADLRRPRGSELAGGPFDEYFHTADIRKARGTDGLYNIPKIVFYLYRLESRPLVEVTPAAGPNAQSFTFDPSGRDIPLFACSNHDQSFDWDQWRSAKEWELPAPIRCRELGDAEYLVTEASVLALIATVGLPLPPLQTCAGPTALSFGISFATLCHHGLSRRTAFRSRL